MTLPDMITAAGHEVFFLDPSSYQVNLIDIKVHSTNINRYNGALFWKLVQHACLVSRLVETNYPDLYDRYMILQRGFASIHDHHEIIVQDIVHGFKKHLPNYRAIEHIWEQYFHQALGLPWEYRDHKIVRAVDSRALVTEMTQLGHPAATRVAEVYGGPPTEEEVRVFNEVNNQSLEESWHYVYTCLIEAQAIIKDLKEWKKHGNQKGNRVSRSRHDYFKLAGPVQKT